MCEKSDTVTPESAGAINSTELAPAVDLSSFSAEEIARLVAARESVAEGTLNEDPTFYRRLRFARWLHDQGQIGA